MSRRLDHSRSKARERMARQGIDSIADDRLPGGLTPPRARPSKAALRAELAEALSAATRAVKCAGCGHSANVTLPKSARGRKLRCSRCGSLAESTR